MNRKSVVFVAPRTIEVREERVGERGASQVALRTLCSALSAGTELHFYRGDLREDVALDEGIASLGGSFRYPATYGYQLVAEPVDGGPAVFSFQPHVSHFVAEPEELLPVPERVTPEAAALWPTVETAVNLALDARPLVGERVLVVGQGVVGLVATFVLSRFPLECLWSVDPLERRRHASLRMGAARALSPSEMRAAADFDLAIELSGRHEGLELALDAVGPEGRVVTGSWYGDDARPLRLDTHFHRGRIRIESSQVTHLAPGLRARWTKTRRMAVAGRLLGELPLETLVTHRFPVERAAEAYELADRCPESCLQILLTYT